MILARLRRRPFDGDLHQGFLVVSLATATIMATLGSHGLWDCWETHYGEIARRQLEQDDWIGLFWENKWFYSKPVLIFWLMNLGMVLFGVEVGPDMVSGHAEWGLRFFVGVLSIAVLYGLYALIAKRVSKRAGLFVAIAVAMGRLVAEAVARDIGSGATANRFRTAMLDRAFPAVYAAPVFFHYLNHFA